MRPLVHHGISTATERGRFVANLPAHGVTELHSDIKVYKDHAFIVKDHRDNGIQVFDLTRLRDIDYDDAPVTVDADTVYHGPDEHYTGRELCFASNPSSALVDALTIVDVTDKSHPVMVGSVFEGLPNTYSHQGWLTPDQRYFLHDDESDNGSSSAAAQGRTRTRVFDVTDLTHPVLQSVYHGETRAPAHNLYTRGRYMYNANYIDGLRVVDITKIDHPGDEFAPETPAAPDHQGLREVACFDTDPYRNDMGIQHRQCRSSPALGRPEPAGRDSAVTIGPSSSRCATTESRPEYLSSAIGKTGARNRTHPSRFPRGAARRPSPRSTVTHARGSAVSRRLSQDPPSRRDTGARPRSAAHTASAVSVAGSVPAGTSAQSAAAAPRPQRMSRDPGPRLRGDVLASGRDPEVQRFGRDIGTIGPADRPELRVELNSTEVHRIAKRLKDATPIPVRGVKLTADAVIERKPQTMLADNLDVDHPVQMSREVHARDATEADRCVRAERCRARGLQGLSCAG